MALIKYLRDLNQAAYSVLIIMWYLIGLSIKSMIVNQCLSMVLNDLWNPGMQQGSKIRGDNVSPLVEIGLTDPPKSGGTASPLPPTLLHACMIVFSEDKEHLVHEIVKETL